MGKILSLSVHDIVDAVLRTGSLDDRVFNNETMEEGSVVHRMVQSEQGPNYHPEYPLETLYSDGDLTLDIQGRADGLILGNGVVTIDEIKSTVADLDAFKEANYPWHQGQAKMYAWMYARENGVNYVNVRMTYVRQHRERDRRIFEEMFSFAELDSFAKETIGAWLTAYRSQADHIRERNRSLEFVEFPFASWRNGQRDMYDFAARIASKGEVGYCQAPTGIGKTVCAIMPTMLSMKESDGPEKIYYLTSKNSIRRQALKTVRIMQESGAVFRAIALTSKERICLNTPDLKKRCNPVDCPYAVDFYTKLKDVLAEALSKSSVFDMNDVIALARKHTVCPFELQLNMALFCDLVIGDYNYVFDPQVKLEEFKDATSIPCSILVDEAHNLPDRARDMYSASLDRYSFKKVAEELQGRAFKGTRNSLMDISSYLDRLSRESRPQDEDIVILDSLPDELMELLRSFASKSNDESRAGSEPAPQSLLDLKMSVKSFRNMPADGAPNYVLYLQYRDGELHSINCRCLDASQEIRSTASQFHSTLFFSATLSPVDYYVKLLGGIDVPPENILRLPSPFDPKNRLVMIDTGVETRYQYRSATLDSLVDTILAAVESKIGNYLVFFPSFAYMTSALEKLREKSDIDTVSQSPSMSISDRDEFISQFQPNPMKTTVGFAVLGGVFGEGIEMADGALSGVIVVSVGLPGIGIENQKLREYFDSQGIDGFSFAYRFPGFNRVVQAAGRVIRSESDRGIILLIDSRYAQSSYGIMLRETFGRVSIARRPEQVSRLCRSFWDSFDGSDRG